MSDEEQMKNLRLGTTGVLSLGLLPLLAGCSDLRILEPVGSIGVADRQVILIAFALMMIVVIPVIGMSVAIPWRYRAGNHRAVYKPEWTHSTAVEVVVWLVPALIVAALGLLVWNSTYRLDPYAPLSSSQQPVQVDVVSMDWKWLFIYPQLGIASVNQLVFPTGRPLSLRLTSDSVMTSFFIPRLGSQIYAMAGMQTRLNLQADQAGNYLGENNQYSGKGFSFMQFQAQATDAKGFDQWVQRVRRSPLKLDRTGFAQLERPVMHSPVTHYGKVSPGLFENIMARFGGMAQDHPMTIPEKAPTAGPSAQPEKSSDAEKTQATKTTQPQPQEVS
jgi:cytochrome o ubiquinol oxidase subunit 2